MKDHANCRTQFDNGTWICYVHGARSGPEVKVVKPEKRSGKSFAGWGVVYMLMATGMWLGIICLVVLGIAMLL